MITPSQKQRLSDNLAHCRSRLARAAEASGRDVGAIRLLAVTKYAEVDWMRALYDLGVRDFGESRVQRARQVRDELRDLEGLRWHLIGHLQRNKVRAALPLFATIHSLDSPRLADEVLRRLADRRSEETPCVGEPKASASTAGEPDVGLSSSVAPPEFYVEVNVGTEAKKTGLPTEQLPSFLESLAHSPLASSIIGLMAMAPRGETPDEARPCFRTLRRLRDEAVGAGLLRESSGLSMGMSEDFEVAVEEGATVVRVGSRLFDGLAADGEDDR